MVLFLLSLLSLLPASVAQCDEAPCCGLGDCVENPGNLATRQCVCAFDPFCCLSNANWDSQCVHEAKAVCGLYCGPPFLPDHGCTSADNCPVIDISSCTTDDCLKTCGLLSPVQTATDLNNVIQIQPALSDDFKLKQLQVAIRHGAPIESPRTCQSPALVNAVWDCSAHPLGEAVNNLSPDIFGNCNFGQLLDWGIRQHQRNGFALRAAYVDSGLLECPASNAFAYSDFGAELGYSRTKQSAEYLVNKIFIGSRCQNEAPPLVTTTWNVLFNDPYDAKDAPWVYQNVSTTMSEVLEWNTRSPYNNYPPPYLCASMAVCNGLPYPNASLGVVQEEWYSQQMVFYSKTFAGVPTAAYEHARLLYELLQCLQSPASTFQLWSAHDNVIFPLVFALGYIPKEWSYFASMMALEVWESKSQTNDVRFRLLYQEVDVTAELSYCSDGTTAELGLGCALSALVGHLQAMIDTMRAVGVVFTSDGQHPAICDQRSSP